MDSTSKFPLLNSPIKVGDVELPNRIAMAALTRCRSDPATNIAAELHLEYFTQRYLKLLTPRANAGFILTECSPVSDRSLSFPGNAGIYNDE
jgi:N-ethylmaleimide reductase